MNFVEIFVQTLFRSLILTLKVKQHENIMIQSQYSITAKINNSSDDQELNSPHPLSLPTLSVKSGSN